jgi:hypothetical protein
MNKIQFLALTLFSVLLFSTCKKENTNTATPRLIFKFVLDSTQIRLNNIGQSAPLKTGNAAQSPIFNAIAAHYIELAPTANTPFGKGQIVYKGQETTKGGSMAILFDSLKSVKNNEVFFSIPISQVPKGTYEWLRVSLAYQNYNIKLKHTYQNQAYYLDGTLASFIGYNSYLNDVKIKDKSLPINANKKQGFWAFEIAPKAPYLPNGQTFSGESAATTVVNPISTSSPIPAGSCVVTGSIDKKLEITGLEIVDVVITVSLSTNKSFEWEDTKKDGWFEPAAGEKVVDMGVRGMKAKLQ